MTETPTNAFGNPSARGRLEQFGVHDELANPAQLAARNRGRYDPRPASGEHVAHRVTIKCSRCGTSLSEVHDFEKRPLVKSLQTGLWHRNRYEAKCATCYRPMDLLVVDGDKINRKLAEARASGRVVAVKAGHPATEEQALEIARRHREDNSEAYERAVTARAAFDAWWDGRRDASL